VTGFRRQAAGWGGNMPPHRFADRSKYRADCTGDVRLRHCLPPLEKCPADASGRAHGPTIGKDTTACFAGGE